MAQNAVHRRMRQDTMALTLIQVGLVQQTDRTAAPTGAGGFTAIQAQSICPEINVLPVSCFLDFHYF